MASHPLMMVALSLDEALAVERNPGGDLLRREDRAIEHVVAVRLFHGHPHGHLKDEMPAVDGGVAPRKQVELAPTSRVLDRRGVNPDGRNDAAVPHWHLKDQCCGSAVAERTEERRVLFQRSALTCETRSKRCADSHLARRFVQYEAI